MAFVWDTKIEILKTKGNVLLDENWDRSKFVSLYPRYFKIEEFISYFWTYSRR